MSPRTCSITTSIPWHIRVTPTTRITGRRINVRSSGDRSVRTASFDTSAATRKTGRGIMLAPEPPTIFTPHGARLRVTLQANRGGLMMVDDTIAITAVYGNADYLKYLPAFIESLWEQGQREVLVVTDDKRYAELDALATWASYEKGYEVTIVSMTDDEWFKRAVSGAVPTTANEIGRASCRERV